MISDPLVNASATPIADAVRALPSADPNGPYAREQAELSARGAGSTATPGTTFPDPELIDVEGRPTSLGRIRTGRPAVVVLYRGAWCPFCNIALRAYRDALHEPLLRRGIELVAISPQRPDGSLSMQEKQDLDFAVVSDPGNRIARALGVLTHPSDPAREAQLRAGLDLTEVNADGTVELPMPTVAIVDRDGVLVWIDVHPDYSTRTEPAEILAALEELGL